MAGKYPRWLTISVGLGLLALLAVGYGLFGRSKVTEDNFDKIGPDMSLAEVEAILGKGELVENAGGDVNALSAVNRSAPKEYQGKLIKVYRWRSGKNIAYVHFVGDNCEKNISKSGIFP